MSFSIILHFYVHPFHRALELLLPSDNKDTAATSSCATQKEIGKNTRQYDAVILSTDSLLVMDALCVTMALRDSEKFRRSKAQEVLSQAVRFEGHSSLPKVVTVVLNHSTFHFYF